MINHLNYRYILKLEINYYQMKSGRVSELLQSNFFFRLEE